MSLWKSVLKDFQKGMFNLVAMVTIIVYPHLHVPSELLGNDNPWYCPRCQESRLAERTLAIQAIPNSLIIQLKRLVCVCVCVARLHVRRV